jgi:hypothetical protein
VEVRLYRDGLVGVVADHVFHHSLG